MHIRRPNRCRIIQFAVPSLPSFKMIVMEPVRRLLRVSGIWFEPTESWRYRLYRCTWLCMLLMLVPPQFAFLRTNLDDMTAATDVSIQLVSELMAACKVFGYMHHSQTISHMLHTFQDDFDSRACLHTCAHHPLFDRLDLQWIATDDRGDFASPNTRWPASRAPTTGCCCWPAWRTAAVPCSYC